MKGLSLGNHWCLRAAALVFGFTIPALSWATGQASLTPASSEELQRLLQMQESQKAVLYQNNAPPRQPKDSFDRLFMWNEIALDTTAIDHTPISDTDTRVFGENFGPTRSSRAMAIVHIAIFEAVNAVTHKYQSYTKLAPVASSVSVDAAIAQAAHDALADLYPSQKPRLDAIFDIDLVRITGDPTSVAAGRDLGKVAAQSIVDLRSNDGSQVPEPRVGGPFPVIGGPGHWSPDPVSKVAVLLGGYWSQVKPFTLSSADQFRAPPPPALTDAAYTEAFNEIKKLGGDPRFGTPTQRTHEESLEGVFWAYDGTPALCAPPRLYNQLARTIVLGNGMNHVAKAARLLAMINTAMADAAIAAWDTKWHYQYWRPVTAIRSSEQGGNGQVEPDANWYPLGAPATNTHGVNFTPPFPAYVSGHATIGGSLFQILRHIYPGERPFVFVSDEWNGLNKDVYGNTRPLHPMFFPNFTDAEQRNGRSRIYLGIHWQFDSDEGVRMGNKVGDWVWGHAFQPVGAKDDNN